MSESIKEIIYSMHPLMRKTLPNIDAKTIEEISKKSNLSVGETQVGIDMLVEKNYVIKEKLEQSYVTLDKLGEKFKDEDLPEIKVLKQIIKKPKLMSELKIEKDEFSQAIGILKQNKLAEISKEKDEMKFTATNEAEKYLKNFKNELKLLKDETPEELLTDKQLEIVSQFEKRKGFIKKIKKATFEIIYTDKGKEIAKELNEKYKNLDLLENISREDLKSGSWKGKEFRHYDIDLDVPILDIGRRHPMIESNNIVRDIFVEMGFKEMVGPIVESEFWCFDSLWIPQDHPARDDQDTFFLEGTAQIPEHVNQVKKMHEKGIKKSHTPEDGFSLDITKRTILRTHSTATTFRYLYDLGKKLEKGENVDGKYFYTAHNFRNEAIDATHLAEFFQAEGCIIGDNLSLADLMGFVKEYYAKLGITKIRFKPTFNPYTEPSMEAHYYDEKMDKWYALINSGIFRQETLEPLGLGNKTIIGFGMGATRVAALLSGAENLRALTGTTCDFEWLRTRPIMKRNIVGGKK